MILYRKLIVNSDMFDQFNSNNDMMCELSEFVASIIKDIPNLIDFDIIKNDEFTGYCELTNKWSDCSELHLYINNI